MNTFVKKVILICVISILVFSTSLPNDRTIAQTPNGVGYNLDFDGIDDYVDFEAAICSTLEQVISRLNYG